MRASARAALVAAALACTTVGLVAPDAVAIPDSGRSTTVQVAAPAADQIAALPVTLTSVSPAAPAPGDTLTISGEVTNTGSVEARKVAVRLRLSPTPVRNRSEITEILAGEAGRTGITVESTRTPVTDTLAPGARAPFSLSIAVDDLSLTSVTPELVVIGVESLASLSGTPGGVQQTGYTRTFLPWFPDPAQVEPTKVVWLFPLTTAPARSGDGVFLDDHIGDEVAPEGRLSRLLDVASAAPTLISWVVDPQLLDAVSDMADGYVVRSGDDESPGTHVAAAVSWLQRLRTLTAGAEVTASAYADPDVVALHRAGLDVDVALAATTASGVPEQVLGRAVGRGLAWPPGGVSDDGTLDVLRASGARVVVLSSDSLPPSPSVSYTPSGSVDLATGGSPLRAAAFDPAMSELVSRPAGPAASGAADVADQQTLVAELAMVTLELPRTSRTVVIAPEPRWTADADAARTLASLLASSPFAVPERLDALLSRPASDIPRARADYTAEDRAAELPRNYLAAVQRARDRLAGLRSVAPDVAGMSTADLEAGLTRTESSAWRAERAQGRRLFASVSGLIDDQIELVRVLSRAPVTLPGDVGVIPVTVANDLDRPARVGVRLTGTPSVRFEADDIEPVVLAPGQKVTLEVNARVVGTGPVDVDIALLTPEGEPFGDPIRTEVRSAAYARAAQWAVLAFFGVLVALLGINVVRRRRLGPLRTAKPDDTDPVDPTPSGGAA